MALKRKPRPDADINVGPFSDIAFLMIIFFILATTLIKPAGGKLDIPSAHLGRGVLPWILTPSVL